LEETSGNHLIQPPFESRFPAQESVQAGFECLQRKRNLSGQLVLLLCHSQSKIKIKIKNKKKISHSEFVARFLLMNLAIQRVHSEKSLAQTSSSLTSSSTSIWTLFCISEGTERFAATLHLSDFFKFLL